MRFSSGILCGLAAMTGIYFLVYWYSPFRVPSLLVRTLCEWYDCKEDLLGKSPAPRIILFGGSNGIYGVSMRRISEETGWRTVNYAISASMELDYRIHGAKKFLKPGDVVILALEYQYYNPPSNNPTNTAVILERDRGYFLQLPIWEKLAWVYGEAFPAVFERLWQTPERAKEVATRWEQVRGHLNSHGDYTGHWKCAQSPAGLETIELAVPIDIAKISSGKNARAAWALIGGFATWCRAKGITVLATFPTTIYFPDYDTAEAQDGFQRVVEKYRALGIPMLGTPHDFIWDRADFYDSYYHLNEEAMAVRTRMLLDELAPILSGLNR